MIFRHGAWSKQDEEAFKEYMALWRQQVAILASIAKVLGVGRGVKGKMYFGKPVPQNNKLTTLSGGTMKAKDSANNELQDVQKVSYCYFVDDGDGNAVNPNSGDSLAVSSADTDSATVVPDATPDPAKIPANAPAGITPLQTGFVLGGKKLQQGVAITSQLTLANPPAAGQPAAEVDLFDIIAGPEVTGGQSFGTPVAQ